MLAAERARYAGMTIDKVRTELGKPDIKYICKQHSEAYYFYYPVWQYSDSRVLWGKKYLGFSPELNFESPVTYKLDSIRDFAPPASDVCSPYASPQEIEFTPEEWVACAAAQRQRPTIDDELRFIRHAEDTLSKGDLELAYRLLEHLMVSEYPEARRRAKQLMSSRPQILEGGKRSFSVASLEKSHWKYREQAAEMERKRLAIFEKLAPPVDYREAKSNYESIFGALR